MRVRKQVRHLRLQRARVHDFAERSVRSERQQVARNVEGPGLKSALVGFLLHVGRLGRDADQVLRHVGGERVVLGEKKIQSFAVELAGYVVGAELGRVVAAPLEILVAGGALLAVPSLFVGQFDGGENREPLDRQRDMRQVGDGAVAILKVERVEKFLRLLRADFAQGLLHRQR